MADLKRYWCERALDAFSEKTRKSQQQIFSPILWIPLLFLLMGLGASGKETPPRVISGILGGSVTFLLNISINAEIELITWTYLSKTLVLAITSRSDITILLKEYSGRLNISQDGYSLYMNNVTKSDSGSYQAQIIQKSVDHTVRTEFILHVYEQLQEPQVTVKSMTSSENDSCTVTLICTVNGSKDGVQYSWIRKDTHNKTSHESHILRVSPSACDPDLPYTCTARNPVSQNSSQPVHVRQFCTGTSRKKTTEKTVVGILGEPVTLSLEFPANQETKNVVWVFNTSVISQEPKGTATVDPHSRKSKSSEERRLRISDQDSSLKISQLKMEDTGPYHAYVCSETSRGSSVRHFTLLVYQRLKKPNVTQSPVHMTNGICEVILTCSVEGGGKDVRYTWMPLQKEAVMSQGKSHLNVSWKIGERLPNFTCTTHNPVSNSSRQLSSGSLCSGPERNKRLWILLLLGLFLGMLIGGCFILKKRKLREGSSLAIRYSQAKVPAEIPETPAGHIGFSVLSQQYEKLDMPAKTIRHHSTATSDTSSESSAPTEEDDEKTRVHSTVNGRSQVYDLFTQEDSTHDLASEGQAEYEAVSPDDKVAKSMNEEDTAYTQESLIVQRKNPLPQKKEGSNTTYCSIQKHKTGENPLPQKKEDSNTIYCSIQKHQMTVQTPQQDTESPETPTYENFT